MENIFKELRQIINKEYDFRIEMSSIEFNVILSREMFEDFEITITYGFEGFPYVNFYALNDYMKEKNEKLTDYDYGYDEDDIKAINAIMDWMKSNSNMLLDCMDCCNRIETKLHN